MTVVLAGKQVEINDKDRTKTEIWTRVMGYYRPVEYFNQGKQAEFAARLCFQEPKEV